jgi:hypothetical protein
MDYIKASRALTICSTVINRLGCLLVVVWNKSTIDRINIQTTSSVHNIPSDSKCVSSPPHPNRPNPNEASPNLATSHRSINHQK